MADKRVHVWVQRFTDRPHLMLQWNDPETGKRKTRSAGTADPKAAEAKRTDLESDLNNGRYAEPSKMTWERFRGLFEAEYVAPLRPNTRLNHQQTLDLFERLCEPKRLAQVTARTVSRFVAGLRGLPGRGTDAMAPGTIKVRLEFLRTALNWAVGQGLLAKCPKFPAVKVPDRKPQPVPAETVERLLAKAPDDQTRAYLLTCWLAGLRRNEAFLLEWEETDEAPYLDLPRNRIVLPAGFVKGVRDQWVPLDRDLRAALLALPRSGRKVFRFTNPRNGQPIAANSLGSRIVDLAKQAGVKLTVKTLRKGFGCRYAGKVPAQVLQKLMRHGDIKTTMAYYANVDDAVMEAVLGGKEDPRNSSRNTPAAAPEVGEKVS